MKYQYMYRTYLRYKKLCIQYHMALSVLFRLRLILPTVQAQCANNIMQSLYNMQLLLQRRN